jgi:hypothetical protein
VRYANELRGWASRFLLIASNLTAPAGREPSAGEDPGSGGEAAGGRANDPLPPSDKAVALAALYQAERQDVASLDTLSLSLIGGALAYLAIATLLIGNEKMIGDSWVTGFVAFPLWIASSYHTILVAANLVRTKSIEILEHMLVEMAGVKEDQRQDIGYRAVQRVWNVDEQPIVLKAQTFVTYGGVGLVTMAFTAYCLTITVKNSSLNSPEFISATVIYSLLFASIIAAWVYVLRLTEEITTEGGKPLRARSTS